MNIPAPHLSAGQPVHDLTPGRVRRLSVALRAR